MEVLSHSVLAQVTVVMCLIITQGRMPREPHILACASGGTFFGRRHDGIGSLGASW